MKCNKYEPTSNADLSSSMSVSNSGNFLVLIDLYVISLLEIIRPRGVKLVKLSFIDASIVVWRVSVLSNFKSS